MINVKKIAKYVQKMLVEIRDIMNIYDTIPDNKSIFKEPVVTIGNFDGVHLGHQKIISVLKNKSTDQSDIVITFKKHPKTVLYPESPFKYLMTLDERIEEFRKLGVSNLVIIDFNHELASMGPADFIESYLIGKLGIKGIVMGYDHSFGRKREGNIDNLIQMSDREYKIYKVPPIIIDDHPISSTRIRNCLLDGKASEAASLLGRHYFINGYVVRGEQRGRKLGFPTANAGLIDPNKVLPSDGVYAAKIKIEGYPGDFEGMLNIGNNPTFENTNKTVEMNIFNFNDDIYDKKVKIIVYKKIRNEIKFKNAQELSNQLNDDRVNIQNYYKLNK